MADGSLAGAVHRLAEAVEAATPRPLDRVPRSLRATGPGLQAMAAQFRTVVPAAYLTETGLRCVCGADVVLARPFVQCPGGCTRFFMPTAGGGAKVAGPYPVADDLPPAA